MSETNQREQEIEISIAEAKAAVDRKDKLDTLLKSKEFDELFTVGYMQNESQRLVSLLADDEWQTPERQKSLIDDMRGISALRQYIINVRSFGRQMESNIASSEQVLEELRNAEYNSEEEGY